MQDAPVNMTNVTSRRLVILFFSGWILFNAVKVTIADYWYSLNFSESWTAADYPPLRSDNTKLLPWMLQDYPPLNNPDSNIRLLYIHPAHDVREITASLRSVSFLEHPQYRALSYTWGDSRRLKPVTVNGKRMDITENLWKALFNIRDSKRVQVLWVDAICIDQSNNDEKSIQIPLMSFIYSRAREVIVWLGDHKPPRWVEQGDISQWQGNWAVRKANDYWPVTKYWLYLLTQEEYWKRCWIVQEIGIASKIMVHSGRHAIPWQELITLMELYKTKVPADSEAVENIFKLETLRQAKYVHGHLLSLTHLLEQFSDCFCSVSFDKLFAFLGLASDCLDGCITVDYSKSPLAVYQELVSFQEQRALRTNDEAIELMHFAGLVRSVLSRKSVQIPKVLTMPEPSEDAHSVLYLICGDERSENCKLIPKLHSLLSWIDVASSVAGRTFSYLFRHGAGTGSLWLSPSPESLQSWTSKSGNEFGASQSQVKVRGFIAGTVCDLGPTYREFIGSPTSSRRWAAKLGNLCGLTCNMTTMRSARAIYNRLATLLGSAADYRLRNFVSLDDRTPYSFYSSRLFVAFGPQREVMMGLTPWETLPGDILVEFWNSDAVLVARNCPDGTRPVHVGRSGLVKDEGIVDWHVATDRDFVGKAFDLSFDETISILDLTRLSLDTVLLPGTQPRIDGRTLEHPKDIWTSHDFEMGDFEPFPHSRDYENIWVSSLSEIPKVGLLSADDVSRSCYINPCQMYVRILIVDSLPL